MMGESKHIKINDFNLLEKEKELKKEKIAEELCKRQYTKSLRERLENFSLTDYEAGTTQAKRATQILNQINIDKRVVAKRLTFINETLSRYVPLLGGSLYLIGAVSGSGKSTCVANIVHPLWKAKKKILVLSNEETQKDVYARIACLDLLNGDFNAWRKGLVDSKTHLDITAKILDIIPYVTVVDNSAGAPPSTIEGIQKTLEEAKKKNSYDCILIDYAQNCKTSIFNPHLDNTTVMYQLRDYLNSYISTSSIPLVLFTQLKPFVSDKDQRDRKIESRIKWCTGLFEIATCVIEIIRDRENRMSIFHVEKDRFGDIGPDVPCRFERGKYVELSVDEMLALEMPKEKSNKNK